MGNSLSPRSQIYTFVTLRMSRGVSSWFASQPVVYKYNGRKQSDAGSLCRRRRSGAGGGRQAHVRSEGGGLKSRHRTVYILVSCARVRVCACARVRGRDGAWATSPWGRGHRSVRRGDGGGGGGPDRDRRPGAAFCLRSQLRHDGRQKVATGVTILDQKKRDSSVAQRLLLLLRIWKSCKTSCLDSAFLPSKRHA